ncbi:PAS domain-containing protein [Methanochimaera problematica]|nr:PAS domain S-box protein [Methanoplanus sp. FWC-SCC4]
MLQNADDYEERLKEIRNRIIGFGEASTRKNYYPELQYKKGELERFRVALDSTSDIVFILNSSTGNIIDANLRACEILGYEKDELLTKSIDDLTDENFFENRVDMEKLRSGTHRIFSSTIWTSRDRGIHMEFNFSMALLGDENFITAVCRDISEREMMEKTIRDSELQYRTTINSLNEVVVVIDPLLNVVIYNHAFEKLCRKTGIENYFSGMPIKEIFQHFHPENRNYTFNEGMFSRFFETNMKFRYGANVTIFSVRNVPIVEKGKLKQSVLYLRDITKYYLLDEMKKEAFMQIDKNMEQFAVLNDHIRNPLQVILGIVDLESPEITQKIIPHVKEIDKLINRLDNGWIESEKVRKMIAKHYGVSLIEKSDIEDAINYLKRNGEDNCSGNPV